MAFKMKGSPAKLGTISGTAGHASALKQVKGGTKTWKQGEKSAESHGKNLNQLVAERKKHTKGSDEYNKIQNQINLHLGSKKRHGRTKTTSGNKTTYTTPGIAEKTTKTSKSGRKTTTTIDREDNNPKGDLSVVTKTRKDGTKKSTKVKKTDLNLSVNIDGDKKIGKGDKSSKIKYDKEGTKKKSKTKYKVDLDKDNKVDVKGRVKRKYDTKTGKETSKKHVERRDGRRYVTKTKDGVTTTKSRRTLMGILTGKGKKKKEE